MKKTLFLLTLIHCLVHPLFAQNVVNTQLEALGTFSGGDNTPFWLTNNKYGLGSTDNNKQYIRARSIMDKRFSQDWNISGGLDIVGSNGFESHTFVQQAFADLTFKKMFLSFGMKERTIPFKNNNLFSGSMTLSNNARPVPQLEIGLTQFLPIPLTNNWLHIRAGGSYGKFIDDNSKVEYAGDGNYAKDVWYHRKYGFIKIEKNTPWSAIIGIEMDTQFGGNFYKKGIHTSSSPTKLKDFFKVLMPMSGDNDSNMADQVNIIGNVYGSYQMIFEYRFNNLSFKTYYDHYFEDQSGIAFKNMPDGIYGIELSKKEKSPISSIVVEYIHTKNQSGPFLWDINEEIPVQVSAGDNYYNHGDYVSISNYGFTMGNPLLTSPIYNKGTSLMVKNSRITAYHIGVGGNISDEIDYRLLLSYSKSWGTSYVPTRNIKEQVSSMMECSYSPHKLQGWTFSGAIALDKSSMVGDNFGIELKLSKSFNSKF